MTRYATGARAVARCPRCGDKVPYLDLVADGRIPKLWVCPGCRDIKPPQEQPFRTDEGIALKHPAPDVDDDSAVNFADTTGTARAGTATTITLATTASAQTDCYNRATITLTSGTGSGQSRTIQDYDGPTRVATVAAWDTQPDGTTTYSIDVPALAVQLGFSNYFGGG